MCVLWEPRPARRVEEIADSLESLSPVVEVEEPSQPRKHRQSAGQRQTEGQQLRQRLEAFLDVTGCRLPPDLGTLLEAQTGSPPRLAVGSSKFVARIAAILGRPRLLAEVPAGREKDFLAPLPIDLLPLTPETRIRLRQLGLTTMGQLASLPRSALAAQFGAEGERAWDLAGGIDEQILTPRKPSAQLSRQVSFDNPMVDREVMVAALETVLGEMAAALAKRELACGAMSIGLHLPNGERQVFARLPHPTSSLPELADLLRRHLPTTLPSPVMGATLILLQLKPGREQVYLFTDPLLEVRRQKQNEAVAYIQRRWGENAILRVVPREPRSLLPERRLAFVPWPIAPTGATFAGAASAGDEQA